MPSKSKSQQRFMGMVRAAQKGELENPSKSVKKAAKSMDKDDVDDFASTKHKGKPEKVKREMKVKNLIKKMVREELAKMNEGKLNERLHVVDERYVGKYIIWVLQDGNKIRTAVLGKKGFDNISQLLFDQAMLLEGAKLKNPTDFVNRLNTVLSNTL